jgi:hypothetical protein
VSFTSFLKGRRLHPAVLIATAGAVVQIVQWAQARPLWLDEEMIALNVRERGIAALAGPLWLGQSAPLGWLAIERVMLVTFGQNERALRALPVAFGIATLFAAAWVGRRWLTPVAACLFVFLCASAGWLTFHFFELKPYSADAFWGLLLPALAAWAAESIGRRTGPERETRAATWWTVAAAGQWFGNGALLVTPFCAVVLVSTVWRRRGLSAAVRATAPALLWAAAFALHFWLAMRFTWGSSYLHEVWAGAMPPADAGLIDRLHWLGAQFAPFAGKPGGTGLAALFWLLAIGGFAIAVRVDLPLRLAFATVPVAAFLLAGLRLVPLYERLSLWMVPSLYVGIALTADAGVRLARRGIARRGVPEQAIAAAVLSAAAVLMIDIGKHGIENLGFRPARSNHMLDDRSAVRWLMAHRQPGDVVMTTYLALPAIWWYGGITIAPPNLGRRLPDGSPIFEVGYSAPGGDCHEGALGDALAGHPRVLVYLGFRFDDVPRWFDDFLLDRLSALGTMTAYKAFVERTRVAIFDLRERSARAGAAYGAADAGGRDESVTALGCLGVRPTRRW